MACPVTYTAAITIRYHTMLYNTISYIRVLQRLAASQLTLSHAIRNKKIKKITKNKN